MVAVLPLAVPAGAAPLAERRAARWRPGPSPMALTILAPGVVLHEGLRELRREALRLPLTPTEYALLIHLVWNPARIVPDDELIDAAWGRGAAVAPQTLYRHVSSLRRKLGRRPRLVRRHGVGYLLERE